MSGFGIQYKNAGQLIRNEIFSDLPTIKRGIQCLWYGIGRERIGNIWFIEITDTSKEEPKDAIIELQFQYAVQLNTIRKQLLAEIKRRRSNNVYEVVKYSKTCQFHRDDKFVGQCVCWVDAESNEPNPDDNLHYEFYPPNCEKKFIIKCLVHDNGIYRECRIPKIPTTTPLWRNIGKKFTGEVWITTDGAKHILIGGSARFYITQCVEQVRDGNITLPYNARHESLGDYLSLSIQYINAEYIIELVVMQVGNKYKLPWKKTLGKRYRLRRLMRQYDGVSDDEPTIEEHSELYDDTPLTQSSDSEIDSTYINDLD